MTLAVSILGTLEANVAGRPIVIGGAQQRRLLAHLALSPGHTRSLDSVVSALWPDGTSPNDARQSVHTAVSRLRSAVGDPTIVVTQGGGYALHAADTDAVQFIELVRTGRQATDDNSRVDCLRQALALWRGPAIEEFAHEDWARPDAVLLDESRAHAADELAEALLRLGLHEDAAVELEGAAARSPLRERTHRLHMYALNASGRAAEALRVYQTYRQRLATDLGLEPSHEIRRAEAEIAAGTAASFRSQTPGSQHLKSYQIAEQIGAGAFSVVYRGRQPSVDRDVAVKVIRAELADRPEFVRRFEAEAQLVARLEHPFIVPLYDFWREPGSAYLVMRLLRGGTLESVLRTGPIEATSALRMIHQVGSALETAHHAGVVHRDVRPGNIMLDEEGNFFLADFGIAVSAPEMNPGFSDSQTLESAPGETPTDLLVSAASVGSPAYASPEQLRRKVVGKATDIYALGICLFEVLAGRLPFHEANSLSDLISRQISDPLPLLHDIRPEIPRRARRSPCQGHRQRSS